MTSPERIRTSGTFTSFDGTKIYYETHGTGKPIVLCYGLACSMNHWIHQVQPFASNYQVILWDYRGHHFSEVPTSYQNLDITSLAKDLALLFETLRLPAASLWGHSFGVPVLLEFVRLYPEKVSNLVFINGFAKNPILDILGFPVVPQLAAAASSVYDQLPSSIRYLWQLAVNNPLALRLSALAGGFNLNLTHLKDIEVYAQGVASVPLPVFLRLFQSMVSYSAVEELEKINAPALIVSGAKDLVTPLSFQEELQKKISGSELCRAPEGSHCTQLDLPDFVNSQIKSFLEKISYF